MVYYTASELRAYRRPVYRVQCWTAEEYRVLRAPLHLLRRVPAFRGPESKRVRNQLAARMRVLRREVPLQMRRVYHESRLRNPSPGVVERNVPLYPV